MDIRLRADRGADRPEIQARQGTVARLPHPHARLAILHAEVVIGGGSPVPLDLARDGLTLLQFLPVDQLLAANLAGAAPVQLEDAPRLAAWLFGAMPKGSDPKVEERVELRDAVPVFVTYLTAEAKADGVVFRADPYGRDAAVLARFFREETQLAAAGQH